ncbi:YjbF family lipoprotein [Alkalimonas amylolytica]|uniref:Group 4 capsule polysaccharide lipoprotein gfcB, YjbF n=1 Tax=Alkalimonas amylolytica TaxID=152573 RepID=A0A1H3ZYB9_ALKAM|nr:YjbF family lipoprotein [Alkalimonas amylolytica]SEA28655.1 Group 4 capsule polysaccharide lipoprotein gfcB, YjbF [Alkalimonas amylolytica]
MNYCRHFVVTAILACSLIACSSTQYALLDTIRLGFSATEDVTLTLEEVAGSEFDLIYIQPDNGPRATMVLAELEHGQHKWLSADNVMLVLEHGRIVRSLGLNNDLTYVSNTAADPLRQKASLDTNAEWRRLTDWQYRQQSGYQLASVFGLEQAEITVFERVFSTRLIREQVTVAQTKETFENLFWFDESTGVLLQSRQQLAPHSPVFHIIYISQAARLIKASTAAVRDSMDTL